MGLHEYHEIYQEFPPAYTVDENGKPMHSWRVLILPYIEQGPLFKEFDLNEPWGAPNNRKLIKKMHPVYACPSSHSNQNGTPQYTNYVAVVGPRTAWPGTRGRKFDEISDGTEQTVVLLKDDSAKIPWTKPDDLKVDESLKLLTSQEADADGIHRYEDFFYRYGGKCIYAFADGSVKGFPHDESRELL